MIPEALLAASAFHPVGFREVTPTVALDHLADLRVVDVREPEEFHGPLGHIPGAELVPLATVPRAAGGWDRRQPILVVCRSGGRSARAAAALTQMGFVHVVNLYGGMLEWDAEGLPSERHAA